MYSHCQYSPDHRSLQYNITNVPIATNLSVRLLTTYERAAGRENLQQSHEHCSRHVSRTSLQNSATRQHLCSWISPSALNGVVTHTELTLTLSYVNLLKPSCIHFSQFGQAITPSFLAAVWSADNKMAAFCGRWPHGCMTLHQYCVICVATDDIKKGGLKWHKVQHIIVPWGAPSCAWWHNSREG